jgi:TatD DNase family protein
MKLIDTHCHLYLDEFDEDRQQVMERAAAQGVERFYLPAIDSTVLSRVLQMEKDFPGRCSAMTGLHPCSVKENYATELLVVEQQLSVRKFAAIGESGLDFYWDKTFVSQQYDAFKKQVDWAKQYGIPVVIHSRQSTQECIDLIKGLKDERLTGIFHCFGGSLEEARQISALGFYLGIGGVVTYKNSGLAAVIEQLPLDNIVLETDAPYLTPAPFRGKRNESAYLQYIAQKIADIKKMTIEEVAAITSSNADKVFKYNS